MQVLAAEPSDYSYFNTNLLRTWAGPDHWKVKPKSKGRTKIKCRKQSIAAVGHTNCSIDQLSACDQTLPHQKERFSIEHLDLAKCLLLRQFILLS